MKVIYIFIICLVLSGWENARSQTLQSQAAAPQIKILMPEGKSAYVWGEQVRYSIVVSDQKDGESKYGEIPAMECLLTLEYLPVNKQEEIQKTTERKEEKGLSLIKKSTCFGCHAQKTRLAGPSFQQIAAKYGLSKITIDNLGKHIQNGSQGIWGEQQMPAHPDFTEEQRNVIAKYVLEIGNHPYRWIYPGLEGTFRIIDKPSIDHGGVYVLTASYTSTSGAEGRHSVVLIIK